jgi:DNA-binding CsgD family transcriptional regulator
VYHLTHADLGVKGSREKEVIMESLGVKTVSADRLRMLRKLGLKNNAELTVYATRNHSAD